MKQKKAKTVLFLCMSPLKSQVCVTSTSDAVRMCSFKIIITGLQALQSQTTGHQTAIDTLSKTAESLIASEGDLLSNSDEIQETVGKTKI